MIKLIKPIRLTLDADTAEELMTPNPISLRFDASVHDAIVMMTDRNFDVAPVIDEHGRPIGVVSATDLLIHNREYARCLKTDDMTPWSDMRTFDDNLPDSLAVDVVDRTCVNEIMTPGVFSVTTDSTAIEVVRYMLELKVHHLFVKDDDGVIVGVISSCDILRRLA